MATRTAQILIVLALVGAGWYRGPAPDVPVVAGAPAQDEEVAVLLPLGVVLSAPAPVTAVPVTPTSISPTAPARTATSTVPATAAPSPTATPMAPPVTPPAPGAIVVDHTSVASFGRIPDAYVEAAAALRMLFIDRSVGGNIGDGLGCLAFPSYDEAPSRCRRVDHVDARYSVDPAVLAWSRPGGYDRSRWQYEYWSGDGCGGWYEKQGCFFRMVEPVLGDYDVVSFQFSYLSVMPGSTIANDPGGYFTDDPRVGNAGDLLAWEAAHPGKTVIYWTTSLARGIGSPESERFNALMRAHATAHGKPLFDVAAILSHDPDGRPCYDNRDGVPYDNGNKSEDHPNDGLDIPAICQHYTTEVEGGHLGSVTAGKIRVAQGFWVLMARLAGWDGS